MHEKHLLVFTESRWEQTGCCHIPGAFSHPNLLTTPSKPGTPRIPTCTALLVQLAPWHRRGELQDEQGA